jgi:hypothetical protein
MSVLRSTNNHYHQQGSAIVALRVSHLNPSAIQLLYSWLEIWMFRHCKSGWAIEADSNSVLSIRFDDVREALYFKLSPEYLKVHVS